MKPIVHAAAAVKSRVITTVFIACQVPRPAAVPTDSPIAAIVLIVDASRGGSGAYFGCKSSATTHWMWSLLPPAFRVFPVVQPCSISPRWASTVLRTSAT